MHVAPALRSDIQVKRLTSNVISISAQGETAAQAERPQTPSPTATPLTSMPPHQAGKCRRGSWVARWAPPKRRCLPGYSLPAGSAP